MVVTQRRMDVDRSEESSSSLSHTNDNKIGVGNDVVENNSADTARRTTLPIMPNTTATTRTANCCYPDPAIVLPLLLGLLRSPPSSVANGGGADEYGGNNDNNNNNSGLTAGNNNNGTTAGGEDENEYSNASAVAEEDDDDLVPPQSSMMSSSSNSNNLYANTRHMNLPQRLHRLLSRVKLRSSAATTSPKTTTAATATATTIMMKQNAKKSSRSSSSNILSWSDHGRSFIVQVNAITTTTVVTGKR